MSNRLLMNGFFDDQKRKEAVLLYRDLTEKGRMRKLEAHTIYYTDADDLDRKVCEFAEGCQLTDEKWQPLSDAAIEALTARDGGGE